jgi:cbb3-type cytochrome oxidase subunit 3
MKYIIKTIFTLFLIFVVVAGIIFTYDKINHSEISQEEYVLIDKWEEEHPNLKPTLKEMLVDDKISKKEFSILRKAVREKQPWWPF